MNLLEHALRLAAHGFHVFPIPAGEKRAALEDYPARASCDPAIVRAFWLDPVLELVQPFNVGISTTRYGIADEPLVAIDVDVKAEKGGAFSVEDLAARGCVFPPTFTQTTPTGGWHHVYRTATPLRQLVSRADNPGPLGHGIDTRSRGGYLVGAGSEVPAGEYTANWLEVADAPAWLVEMLGVAGERGPASSEVKPPARAIDQATAADRAIWYLMHDAPVAVKGKGGDATALAVAMQVKDYGISDQAGVLALMLEHWNPRCPPGWEPAKLKKKVANAFRYGRRGVGADSAEVLVAGAVGEAGASAKEDHLPAVHYRKRQLRDEVEDAWVAVKRSNDREASIFLRAGRIVTPYFGDQRGPRLERVDRDWFTGHLSLIANWLQQTSKGRANGYPPDKVAAVMLAAPLLELPLLETVGTEPVFTASGRLVTKQGYDAEAAYYLHGDGGRALEDIPEDPSDDVAEARHWILEELLGDFPFVTDADRAHAVAALVLPLVRRMIDGTTPLHVIEAPTWGTGKSLLANVITQVATGRVAPALSFPTTEEEWGKTITTVLLEAAPAVLLDNAPARIQLKSAALASVLTAENASGRLLGTNTAPTLPNKALWLMTGNNPRLSGEWARRCVRVRINRNVERPWLDGRGFNHPELLAWARSERGALLRSLATLVRAWIARGRPDGKKRLGSYESWSRVVGGILEVAGVPGFLDNAAELYDANDTESGEWGELAERWWTTFERMPVTAAQVSDLADAEGLLNEVLGSGNALSRQSRMGRALLGERDAIHGGYRVETGSRPQGGNSGKTYYRLAPIEGSVYA